MRILWNVKDSPFLSSGYAKVAYYLSSFIRKEHQLVLQAPIGLEHGKVEFEEMGVWLYGRAQDITGDDVCLSIYEQHGCDVYLTLQDLWVFQRLPGLAEQGKLTWVPIATTDFEPVPAWLAERVKSAFVIIPPYRKAEQLWREKLGSDQVLSYAYYCGVEPSLYRPLADSKEEAQQKLQRARRSIGGDCDFLTTVIAMNQLFRKNWEEHFRAIKLFQEANPDLRIACYFHVMPRVQRDYDLPSLAEEVGLRNYRFADAYRYWFGYDELDMVRILNASDCLLSLTAGESGNLPVVEAMACGTPAVATNFTINPELLEPFSELLVKPAEHFHLPNAPLRKARPDLDDALRALNRVLNSDPDRYLKECSSWASRQFDWLKLGASFLQRLERVEELLDERCAKPPSSELKPEVVVID